ncbi:site-specific integrase [Planctomycetota bacterium]
MKPTDLALHLSRFLADYLAGERNASPNTIKGYRDAFKLLLRYCRDHHGIPPDRLTMRALTVDVVRGFLADLDHRRRHCARTRNHRLSAIHSFFRYVQSEDPALVLQCQQVLAIPMQRAPQQPVEYLALDDLGAILAAPDLSTTFGRRDAVLLCVLYDTAARVQELVDLSVRDVRLDAPAQVHLTGKGRKTRVVPLMSSTVALLREYLREHDLLRPERASNPLLWNRRRERLTRSGVRYILNKHAKRARAQRPGLPAVHPHKLRHSKAMHLLQAGNPMVIIQAVLGHADVRSSSIYARADAEMTRAALEKANDAGPTRPSLPSWQANAGLMEWLRSL